MTRKFEGKKLLVATHNKGKLAEIADLLQDYGVSVVGAAEMNLPEPVEDGTTFVENARIKAHAAAKATGLPALSDDSGLEIDALNGAPGVYTADWAETETGRDFIMAMEKAHTAITSLGSAAVSSSALGSSSAAGAASRRASQSSSSSAAEACFFCLFFFLAMVAS